jgi:hypothetical protein
MIDSPVSNQTLQCLFNETQIQKKRFCQIFVHSLLLALPKTRIVSNFIDSILQDHDICANLPGWLNDWLPQVPLSVIAKLNFTVQREAASFLEYLSGVDIRTLVLLRRNRIGFAVPLTLVLKQFLPGDLRDIFDLSRQVEREQALRCAASTASW